MKKFQKILDGLENKSPLPLLFENGYTPELIKKEIVTGFSTYFKNQNRLNEYAIDYMVSDWINLLKLIIKYPNIENEIQNVLNNYNDAKQIDSDKTLQVLSQLMNENVESGNKFWSIFNLQVSRKDLGLYEFAQTSFKDISDIIEGITKNTYIENVLVNKIRRGKPTDIENVQKNKLGNLIQDLIDNSRFSHLFIVPNENLKLSDWRNIAAHHNYSIVGNIIRCVSGEGERKLTFDLTREELFKRTEFCLRTTEILSMAHKIFAFDNLPEISERLESFNPNARPEIAFLMFSSALMSQGFEIKNFTYDSELALLELSDMTDGDPKKRGIHSSQLLNRLWILTESKKLEIRYFMKSGIHYLTSNIDDKIFKEMESTNKDISYFANNVNFKIESNG